MTHTTEYAAALLSLKTEIDSLKTTIAMAIEQITNAIKSLINTPHTPESNAMDTKAETVLEANQLNQTQLDIPSLINDLKHEIPPL